MAVGINSGTLFQASGKQIRNEKKNSRTNNLSGRKTAAKRTFKGSYVNSDINEFMSADGKDIKNGADITTKNGITVSVNETTNGSTYTAYDNSAMLELSEDRGKVTDKNKEKVKENDKLKAAEENNDTIENSLSDSKKTDKSQKEEEYEKVQKQLEALKDMLERTKEAQKNAKKTETKTKKVLNYSYKKVSSNIQSAKNVSQASNAVSSANSNLSALRRKAASGNYDDDEINIAISHAKRMITVAKRKLAHIKQEAMNKKDDDKYISSKKETVVKLPDKKIRAEQQEELRRIEDEIKKEEKKERQSHRGEENNKLLDADMTYIKAKIEIWKRGGGDFGIMMAQSQGAAVNMDMTQTLTNTSKLALEQTELSAGQSATGQTDVAASINLSV